MTTRREFLTKVAAGLVAVQLPLSTVSVVEQLAEVVSHPDQMKQVWQWELTYEFADGVQFVSRTNDPELAAKLINQFLENTDPRKPTLSWKRWIPNAWECGSVLHEDFFKAHHNAEV